MLSIQWKVPERERPKGGSDAENACEASGTHALRVQVGGGATGNAAKRQTYCCDSNKDIRRRRQKSREAAH